MIGWKPLSIRWPAAALLGSDNASGAITSARPIASTAHSSLRFILTSFVCPILTPYRSVAIRSGADPASDNYSAG